MNFPSFGIAAVDAQLWQLLFLSVRVGGALIAAPVFGARTIPFQVQALFAFAMAVFIHNWVPLGQLPQVLSLAGMLALMQEAVIGLALGFVLQLSFAVPLIAAEQVSGTMGMAIATSVDPSSGSQSGALGQYFSLLLLLVFLALGAHLAWLELVVESYRAMPPGLAEFGADRARMIAEWAGLAFATALSIALPLLLVLLLVQLVTGVLSRSAPTLNLFALGLPAGVLAGLAALIMAWPVLLMQMEGLVEDALRQAQELLVGA